MMTSAVCLRAALPTVWLAAAALFDVRPTSSFTRACKEVRLKPAHALLGALPFGGTGPAQACLHAAAPAVSSGPKQEGSHPRPFQCCCPCRTLPDTRVCTFDIVTIILTKHAGSAQACTCMRTAVWVKNCTPPLAAAMLAAARDVTLSSLGLPMQSANAYPSYWWHKLGKQLTCDNPHPTKGWEHHGEPHPSFEEEILFNVIDKYGKVPNMYTPEEVYAVELSVEVPAHMYVTVSSGAANCLRAPQQL